MRQCHGVEIVKQGQRVDGEFVNWFRRDTKKERNRCATAAGFMPLIIVRERMTSPPKKGIS